MALTPGSTASSKDVFGDFEGTTGSTHSLTTVAGQKVAVFIYGTAIRTSAGSSADINIEARYNNTTTSAVIFNPGNTTFKTPFCLSFYTTPGVLTTNISVYVYSSAGASDISSSNVRINVLKSGT